FRQAYRSRKTRQKTVGKNGVLPSGFGAFLLAYLCVATQTFQQVFHSCGDAENLHFSRCLGAANWRPEEPWRRLGLSDMKQHPRRGAGRLKTAAKKGCPSWCREGRLQRVRAEAILPEPGRRTCRRTAYAGPAGARRAAVRQGWLSSPAAGRAARQTRRAH